MGRPPAQMNGLHDEDLISRFLPATRDVAFHGFVSDLIS